jgi:hypothetical protein
MERRQEKHSGKSVIGFLSDSSHPILYHAMHGPALFQVMAAAVAESLKIRAEFHLLSISGSSTEWILCFNPIL